MLSAFFYPDRTARRTARLEGKSTASHPVRISPVRRPAPRAPYAGGKRNK